MRFRLTTPELLARWQALLGDAALAAVALQRLQMGQLLRAHDASWDTPLLDAPPGLWRAEAWAANVQAEVAPVAAVVVGEVVASMRAVVKPRAVWGMADPTDELTALIVDRVLSQGQGMADALAPKDKSAKVLTAAGGNLSALGSALDYASEQMGRIAERSATAVANGSQTAFAAAASDQEASPVIQEWATQGDDRVRDSHDEMEGQEQPAGTPFESGDGNLLMYPGDPEGPPEDVENCRCELFVAGEVEFLNVGPGGNLEAIGDALNNAVDALG